MAAIDTFVSEGEEFTHLRLGLRISKDASPPHYGRPWVVELRTGALILRAGSTPRRFVSAAQAATVALEVVGRAATEADLAGLGFVADEHGYASRICGLFINHTAAGSSWVAGGAGQFLRSPGGNILRYPSAARALGALIRKGWVK